MWIASTNVDQITPNTEIPGLSVLLRASQLLREVPNFGNAKKFAWIQTLNQKKKWILNLSSSKIVS